MMNFSGNINIDIKEKKYENIQNDIKNNINEKQIIEDKPNISTPRCDPNRCAKCNKKLKLTDIKCRCDKYFCAAHRYSDLHDCPFDYRNHGKKILEKQNPLIAGDKIDKL